jgi:hypothetical protein
VHLKKNGKICVFLGGGVLCDEIVCLICDKAVTAAEGSQLLHHYETLHNLEEKLRERKLKYLK